MKFAVLVLSIACFSMMAKADETYHLRRAFFGQAYDILDRSLKDRNEANEAAKAPEQTEAALPEGDSVAIAAGRAEGAHVAKALANLPVYQEPEMEDSDATLTAEQLGADPSELCEEQENCDEQDSAAQVNLPFYRAEAVTRTAE